MEDNTIRTVRVNLELLRALAWSYWRAVDSAREVPPALSVLAGVMTFVSVLIVNARGQR